MSCLVIENNTFYCIWLSSLCPTFLPEDGNRPSFETYLFLNMISLKMSKTWIILSTLKYCSVVVSTKRYWNLDTLTTVLISPLINRPTKSTVYRKTPQWSILYQFQHFSVHREPFSRSHTIKKIMNRNMHGTYTRIQSPGTRCQITQYVLMGRISSINIRDSKVQF